MSREVVVFPFVPVIPMTVSSFAGSPKKSAEIDARAILESSVRITIASSGSEISFSQTNILAPVF